MTSKFVPGTDVLVCSRPDYNMLADPGPGSPFQDHPIQGHGRPRIHCAAPWRLEMSDPPWRWVTTVG